MAKAYSLASWNVEHFRNPDSRVDRVVDFLVNLGPPDVFALYEVEGKEVFDALVSKMPGYTFHITEGPQVQEIMVGVKSSLTAFFTQKTEFKSGLWALRPGALLTLTIAGEPYPILFLHIEERSGAARARASGRHVEPGARLQEGSRERGPRTRALSLPR